MPNKLDTLQDQLRAAINRTQGHRYGLHWLSGLTATYWERNSVSEALADIERLEHLPNLGDIGLALLPSGADTPYNGRLKLYRTSTDKVPLAEILPILEAMGLRIISEIPCQIQPTDDRHAVWIHDFEVESQDHVPLTQTGASEAIEQTVLAIWQAQAESDGFNRLILSLACVGATWP